jgi:predicted small metal-binding protein
MLKDKGR